MTKNLHQMFVAAFFGGMMAELALLLGLTVRKNYMRLLALPVLAAMILPMGLAYNTDLNGDCTGLLLSGCGLVAGSALLFLPEVLPVITRYHVLSYTITFWYAMTCVPSDGFLSFIGPALLLASAAGAAGALIPHFRAARQGSNLVWNMAYAWYLLALAYIGIVQLGDFSLDFFSVWDGKSALPGPVTALVYGMAITYVSISFCMLYVYCFSGFSQVTDPVRSDDKKGKELDIFIKRIIVSKTLDITLERPGPMAWLLGAQAALAALNYMFDIIPQVFLVNCFVLVMPYLVNMQLKGGSPVPEPEPAR